MSNNEFIPRNLPAFNFRSEINRDLLVYAVNAMVTGPSWSGAGINLSSVVTSIVKETPGSHVTLKVTVSMNADHSNGGSWTDWIIEVPTTAGLDNVRIRLDTARSEDDDIHWTEIGRHMLDFEFDWRGGDDPVCDVEGCS